MTRTHFGQHGPECFGCKCATINFGVSFMENRRPRAAQDKKFDQETNADLPAYKRLVDSGVQPAATKGAAEMERRATTKFEIESGRILPPQFAKRTEKVLADIGSG